ncbi:hypothetical protein D9619_000185 [Psilocybe cf. subviscida]|uniref:Transcription initiation factor TFIID subunit 4 n=1 Tax=Psilocybe cf. subviscida TaxID=2480587 RepID=A0A8H5BGA2_9AGAR|nr:hypothetical protein D9619_000185 [Psilocybe cf. subviscida]
MSTLKAEDTAPATTTTTTAAATPAATQAPAATPQPAQTYTTQWSASPMAIDPALQQQTATHPTASTYYPYSSHYPQAAYATHYQAYQPLAQQQQAQQQQTTQHLTRPLTTQPQYQTSTYSLSTAAASTPTSAPAPAAATTTGTMDTADIATLNDALGSAGVDLRAEEESLQRTYDSHSSYRSYEDRTRKQPPKPAFDTRILGATMRTAATTHKVARVPEESVNYLALALRARLQDLLTAMITAAHHRTDTQFDRPAAQYTDSSPMWSIVVRSDVAKQLAALEKVEREEEMRVRKERKERAEMTAARTAALAAQANAAGAGGANGVSPTNGGDADDGEGSAKKKRKKDGPGVTARNMSEDVRKKMSNAVATQAAGLGGKYSWMTAANAASPVPKAKSAASIVATTASPSSTGTGAAASATTPATPTATGAQGANSTWARPYVPTKLKTETSRDTAAEDDTRTSITMRDAMFVIEKERGHGGGRGAARGWV